MYGYELIITWLQALTVASVMLNFFFIGLVAFLTRELHLTRRLKRAR